MASLLTHSSRRRTWLGYALMLSLTVGAYLFIRSRGADLRAPEPEVATAAAGAKHSDVFAHVLLALAAITLLARVMGGLVKRVLKQPPVIGEIIAGLMLGPSLLGALWPEGYAQLLPAECAPYLGVIAKVGVVLFMFLVGLELDPGLLRGNTHSTVAISHASIIAPFLLGATLALALYPLYSTNAVSFTVFSLFLGVSMSVTAFPVLARILIDRGVQQTPLGATALACAAVDDVTAWLLLAFVASVASAKVTGAAWTVALVAAYILLMLIVVRPIAAWWARRQEQSGAPLSRTSLAVVFTALLLSALATEAIGIHALFGAFALGAMLPHDGRLAAQLREKLEDTVLVLLLPCFFAFTGMRTQIGLLSSSADWWACAAIIAVATLGKFGGSTLAARLSGIGWRQSAALGALMNTRGLMELIVLNLGLDLGVISPTVFTMMVLMALVTTFTATPALDLLLGRGGFTTLSKPARVVAR